MPELRKTNLILLLREGEILLAMKKRRFGAGKWNGVGGKPEQGESIEQAAVRESEEEIRVRLKIENLEKVAVLKFYFPEHKKDWDQEVHVYFVRDWENDPMETEEMRPQWFSLDKVPFAEMWPDDIHWLPRALAGEKLEGEFYFSGEGDVLDKFVLNKLN